MSWKCTVRDWHIGPLDLHVFAHALDPKQRRFYELGVGRCCWQVWPPKHVLDYENEWTVKTDEELLQLLAWTLGRMKAQEATLEATGLILRFCYWYLNAHPHRDMSSSCG